MDMATTQWFDVESVTVERAADLEGFLTDEELINLAGAPMGSTLKASVTDEGAIELRVSNSTLLDEDMVRLLVQEEEGFVFYIVNSVFVLQNSVLGKGIGPRSIAIELEQARALNKEEVLFTRVQTLAVGDRTTFHASPPLRGYYVWPRMGFDAPLPAALLEHQGLPTGLGSSPTLLDVFDVEGGDEFWFEYGSTIKVSFDLAAGSRSWQCHANYAAARNIEVQQ